MTTIDEQIIQIQKLYELVSSFQVDREQIVSWRSRPYKLIALLHVAAGAVRDDMHDGVQVIRKMEELHASILAAGPNDHMRHKAAEFLREAKALTAVGPPPRN